MSVLLTIASDPASLILAGAVFFLFVAGIVVAGIIRSGPDSNE